jgi:hypothetical protein
LRGIRRAETGDFLLDKLGLAKLVSVAVSTIAGIIASWREQAPLFSTVIAIILLICAVPVGVNAAFALREIWASRASRPSDQPSARQWRLPEGIPWLIAVGLLFGVIFTHSPVSTHNGGSPLDAARLEISEIEPIFPGPHEALAYKIHIANNGNLAVEQYGHGEAFRLTETPLTEAEEEDGVNISSVTIKMKEAPSANQIQPGDKGTFFIAVDRFAKNAEVSDILSSKQRLYIFVVMQFKDRNSAEKVWISEFCRFAYGSLMPYNLCKGHNRIYQK